MASVFNRSKSGRSLTIDDSFHREQQQRQRRRVKGRSSSAGKLVRTNSVSSDYARAAGTMPPSASPAPKQRGKGQHMLRSVVGFLSRTKSGKANKPGSFTFTEPASPASATSLSRTNSDSSAHGVGRENGSGRVGPGEPDGAPRPRVSFDAVVQTVYIEQMKEEEVRNTFYCRTEYAAFKEAYRTHRDTSADWCRGNDVLPCNCDACQDDLVEGGRHGQRIYSSSSSESAPVALSPDGDDDCDGAFDAPPPPPNPYAYEHKDKDESECGEREDGEDEEQKEPPPPPSPYTYGHKETDGYIEADKEGGEGQDRIEPPSPVGAVFQDDDEDSGGSSSGSGCSGGGGGCSGRSCRSHASALKRPSTSRYSSARRHSAAAHRRRGTWGVGSVPIASPVGKSHKRGGSLDDWGVTTSVQEAVKCHGEGYAYKTLRLQGFSDLYIRTHFLPEG